MTISAISSASANPFYATQTSAQQSFSQLVSAIQSGNLSAAQNAFSSFTQGAGSQIDPNSPLAQAINQIGQDLQSGNIDAAQQGLNSLKQTAGAHHHHHHHGGGAPPQTASSSTADTTTLTSALSLSSSNIVDVSA